MVLVAKGQASKFETDQYVRHRHRMLRQVRIPSRRPPNASCRPSEIQATLPALLDGCYPLVLTHSDLNEMNILVDPDSGEITGVVDWPNASILPFGFTLYALESALGSMGSSGWQWFDNVHDLRDAF